MSSQPDIGVWGPTDSGKTTYLAGLVLAVDELAPAWKMVAAEGDFNAQKFIELDAAAIDRGVFPATTAKDTPISYSFRLERKDSLLGRNAHHHKIVVVDAAGELIFEGGGDDYFETLRKCKGILCMIDPDTNRTTGQPSPTKNPGSYFTHLSRLLHHLSEEGGLAKDRNISMNLAFCLTKIDKDDHWPQRDNPREYLKEVIGPRAFNRILRLTAPNRRDFFATSVVGRCRTSEDIERPNIEPIGDHYRILDMDQWQPYKPLEPLFWLFDRIEEERDADLPFWRRWLRRRIRQNCDPRGI